MTAKPGTRPAICWPGGFAVIACLLLAGCRKAPEPEVAPEPLSVDESVLLALEPYDPVYKVNSRGRVITLRLEGRQIPASVLDEVCKLTELTDDLSLYGANLTDESLAKLQTLNKLQRLGLGATPITAEGLVHLEPLTSLGWIWMPKELTTTEAAEKLKTAIPNLTIYGQ